MELTDQFKTNWIGVSAASAAIYQKLEQSTQEVTRKQWVEAFIKSSGSEINSHITQCFWNCSKAIASRHKELNGSQPLSVIAAEIIDWEKVKLACSLGQLFPDAVIRDLENPKKVRKPFLSTKTIVRIGSFLLIVSCLFPPWRYTFDANGDRGAHSYQPGPYQFILEPPSPIRSEYQYGVRIDFSRLLLEWAAIGIVFSSVYIIRK